jgi:GntR family transcriptional regulator of arabinose operon
MIEKNKHISIFKSMQEKILNGEYAEGQQLPTEMDLAKELNLSRPTISKVYENLRKAGLIDKKAGSGTFVKIAKKETLRIGFLLAGLQESEIFGPICEHISRIAEEKNIECLWDGVFINAQMRKQQTEKICQNYIAKKIDGVLFSPLELVGDKDQVNERICKMLKDVNIPVILVDRDILPFPQKSEFDVVSIDNYQAGYVMTQHLIDQGAEKIIFLHLPASAPSIDLRIAAFRNALSKSNLDSSLDLIIESDPSHYKLIEQIKSLNKVGILCANDATAAALISALKQNGVEIRNKILIAGIDNMKYANDLHIPLTSYAQPLEGISQWAVDLLLLRIAGNKSHPVQINLQGEIIIRESTKKI